MKQKHISLYGTVATFFDKIFPSVYKYYLNNGTVVTLTQQQEKCLQSNRQDINPQPFGYIPYNISHSLNRALTNVKLYLEVLSLIVEAINSTDYATVTDKCVHQVTKLQFCSHCDNKTNVKPCKGLCLNTMRRCLAQFSILHRDWNGLIVSVVQLGGGQSQTYKVETILKNLDYKIDEAITLAHTNSKHFLHSVSNSCIMIFINCGLHFNYGKQIFSSSESMDCFASAPIVPFEKSNTMASFASSHRPPSLINHD